MQASREPAFIHQIEDAPGLEAALDAHGTTRPWIWTSFARSAAWMRHAPEEARLNHIPGIELLLDPALREQRLRPLVASVTDDLTWWPRVWRLPQEADALRAASDPQDEVLSLRDVDSTFLEPWRITSDIPDGPAWARPLARDDGRQIQDVVVLIRCARPLEVFVHEAAQVPAEALDAIAVLLACASTAWRPRSDTDFCLLRFEWHVAEGHAPQWLDVARGDVADMAPDIVACVEGGADGGFERLDAETILGYAPAHFGDEADTGADATWQVAHAEVGTLDGAPVLFEDGRRQLLPLDPVSGFVWRSLEAGHTAGTILTDLAYATKQPADAIADDVWHLVAAWAGVGLCWRSDRRPVRFEDHDDTPPSPERAALPADAIQVLAELRAARPAAMADDRVPALAWDDAGRARLLRTAITSGWPSPWLPDATWLLPPLVTAWSTQDAGDALPLHGVLVDTDAKRHLLVSENPDVAALQAARARARGARVLAAPFVHIGHDAIPRVDTAGGLLVPELPEAPTSDAPRYPRIIGPDVAAIPLDDVPDGSEDRPIEEIDVLIDQGHERLPHAEALDVLVRIALPPGRALDRDTATRLVALVDRVPVIRVGIHAWLPEDDPA